ncbi:hypothetical protein D3C81_1198680 [compost metagenome]
MDASLELVDKVQIIELDARDGLHGLSHAVETLVRVNLIGLLEIAELSAVELGAFAPISRRQSLREGLRCPANKRSEAIRRRTAHAHSHESHRRSLAQRADAELEPATPA